MDQQNQNLFELQLDQPSTAYLGEAAKWARFLAVMGFIFCALFIIFALFAGTIMGAMSAAGGGGMSSMFGTGFLTAIYLALAVVYFFPCLYLFRFASQMQEAIRDHDQNKLQGSFRSLKSCFRFLGILIIITLCFYVVAIIGGVIVGLTS